MADNTQEAGVWPVNENGSIVLDLDTSGSTNVAGYIPSSNIPMKEANNRTSVKFPAEAAVFSTDSSGSIANFTMPGGSNLRLSKRPLSNTLSKSLGGFAGVPVAVVTNPWSVMLQTVLEGPYDSVRIGFLNASTSAVAGVTALVTSGSTLGAANGTLGLSAGLPIGGLLNWIPVTIGGSSSLTLAASPAVSTGSSGANIGGSDCSITWSDWVSSPSATRVDGTSGLPTFNIVIAYPAGVNRTFLQLDGTTSVGYENEGSPTVAPFQRPARVMVSATKDAVANPAWMMTSNGQCVRNYTDFPAIVIQYTLRNGLGETLLVYGDSIQEGSGATIQKCGWPFEFQAQVSSVTKPLSICNLAVAGTDMVAWRKRIAATISGFSQTSVFIPSLTPNSLSTPITQASISLNYGYFALNRQQTDKAGLLFITSTIIPTNYSVKPYGTSDVTYRVAWNDRMRSGSYPLADFDSVIAGPLDVNGQYTLPAAYTADGIHPNSAGYLLMGTKFKTLWNTL